MDTLFNRTRSKASSRASRPQLDLDSFGASDSDLRALPYDRTTLTRPPPFSGAQPARQNGQNGQNLLISAPNTNPGLTMNGTDLNINAYRDRQKERAAQRDQRRDNASNESVLYSLDEESSSLQSYSRASGTQTSLPIFSPASPAASTPQLPPISAQSDFNPSFPPSSASTARDGRFTPRLSTSTVNTLASDRSSRMPAPSTYSASESNTSFSRSRGAPSMMSLPQTPPVSSTAFYFPRPSPKTLQVMFEPLAEARDIPHVEMLNDDQKYQLIMSDARQKWEAAKHRSTRIEPSSTFTGNAGISGVGSMGGVDGKDAPEYYLKRMIDGKANVKDLTSLGVSLRTSTVDWVDTFVRAQGMPALCKVLTSIHVKNNPRPEDHLLELEILKCFKTLLNRHGTLETAVPRRGTIFTPLISSVCSPHLPSRKMATELLAFFIEYKDVDAWKVVVPALDNIEISPLQASKETQSGDAGLEGRFGRWFRTVENTLEGRGRMGTMVGATEEVRRGAGMDPALNDYAQMTFISIEGLIRKQPSADTRINLRSQMELAGLRRLLELFERMAAENGANSSTWSKLRNRLKNFNDLWETDERAVMEEYDRTVMKDMQQPEDVFKGILLKLGDTKSREYFELLMKNLLLLRREGEDRDKCFQIFAEFIASFVLEGRQPGGEMSFGDRFGASVTQLIARFGDQERLQKAEEGERFWRKKAGEEEAKGKALEAELEMGDAGLVGRLKADLKDMEQKLEKSRALTAALQQRMDIMAEEHRRLVASLERDIRELFRMLREARGGSLDTVLEEAKSARRQELVERVAAQMQRDDTIEILEGRRGKKKRASKAVVGSVDESESGEEPERVGAARRREQAKKGKRPSWAVHSRGLSLGGRTSQFMDADEERGMLEEQMLDEDARRRDPDATLRRAAAQRHTRVQGASEGEQLDSPFTPQTLLPPCRLRNGGAVSFDGDDSELGTIRESETDLSRISGDTQPTSLGSFSLDASATDSKDGKSLRLLRVKNTAVRGNSFSEQLANRLASMGKDPDDGSSPAEGPSSAVVGPNQGEPPQAQSPPPPPPPPPPPGGRGSPIPPPPPPGVPMTSALQAAIASRATSSRDTPGSTDPSSPTMPSPPPPPNPSRASGLNAHIIHLSGALTRKDIPISSTTRMKQLQWDKLPQQVVSKTLWGSAPQREAEREKEWVEKLLEDGVWKEMEEDFKAKQLVINLMAKQKRAELKSVLDTQTKKAVEIMIQRVKTLAPEEIALKILQYDQDLCTETFLGELKRVLPSPEQVGKLNVYRNSNPEELAELHPADRLMVQLIKIDRLAPRIEGMLYQSRFEERFTLIEDGATKLHDAGESLQRAAKFKELLSLILLIGNYMNGTGIKGGAYGFRVSSINKLVDTKSVNSTTLLHFLEKTVSRHFPDMEEFLDELAKPADAYRVNLQDIRKGLGELREGLTAIRQELTEFFSDVDALPPEDRWAKKMWRFVGEAGARLADLVDDVTLADTTLTEVLRFYGEDEKNMTSYEFYGIFKTFVTSYKKCKAENQATEADRAALERRKLAVQQARQARQQANEAIEDESADTTVLDSLLEKLRNGDTISRKSRRRQQSDQKQYDPPLSPTFEGASDGDAVELASNMLAQLKQDGFTPSTPISARPERASRRSRLRTKTNSTNGSIDAGYAGLLETAMSGLSDSRPNSRMQTLSEDGDYGLFSDEESTRAAVRGFMSDAD
ncbi:hypothetical protein DACRYDRAFT_62419 [Dacryopinax primogenitus]|uniref:FH2-domain-containing protein n=1 Tax=Dacryopinax primogenitus (strain DJM 731) TaxID=1858805 RepID=M5G675_DACPD|nr:uncharacterized protein DACRYDRAFT_62419 [Dacryopinax primogenitus]EJU05761.1 hypothetical protein DACRYDRAFT_62419 [Dacryopinax primogenitus]